MPHPLRLATLQDFFIGFGGNVQREKVTGVAGYCVDCISCAVFPSHVPGVMRRSRRAATILRLALPNCWTPSKPRENMACFALQRVSAVIRATLNNNRHCLGVGEEGRGAGATKKRWGRAGNMYMCCGLCVSRQKNRGHVQLPAPLPSPLLSVHPTLNRMDPGAAAAQSPRQNPDADGDHVDNKENVAEQVLPAGHPPPSPPPAHSPILPFERPSLCTAVTIPLRNGFVYGQSSCVRRCPCRFHCSVGDRVDRLLSSSARFLTMTAASVAAARGARAP